MNLNPTEHYVTCFDFKFLVQGITLYDSLCENENDFVLWVVCLDNKVFNYFKNNNYKNLKTLRLSDFENDKLLEVKKTRIKAEYYWTLSPFIPEWVFQTDKSIERLTYLDADMFFFKNPSNIFKEFEQSGKSVLITEHAFDLEYSKLLNYGKFCVQWITYQKNKSEKIIKWWQNRCLEWCFAKLEKDRFGDQKYLDQWPVLFPDLVYVLINKNLILAPWNQSKFSKEAVLWHFHGLRLLNNYNVLLYSYYKISSKVHNNVYKLYLQKLQNNINKDTYLPRNSFKYNIISNYLVFIIKNLKSFFITLDFNVLNPNIKISKLKK